MVVKTSAAADALVCVADIPHVGGKARQGLTGRAGRTEPASNTHCVVFGE